MTTNETFNPEHHDRDESIIEAVTGLVAKTWGDMQAVAGDKRYSDNHKAEQVRALAEKGAAQLELVVADELRLLDDDTAYRARARRTLPPPPEQAAQVAYMIEYIKARGGQQADLLALWRQALDTGDAPALYAFDAVGPAALKGAAQLPDLLARTDAALLPDEARKARYDLRKRENTRRALRAILERERQRLAAARLHGDAVVDASAQRLSL